MISRRFLWIIPAVLVAAVIVFVIATALTPQQTNPAFAAATSFINAAIKTDDATAFGLLDNDMQKYVLTHCPEGRVSECIKIYTPPEWGDAENAIFRRAAPDGSAWNVEIIATYQHDKGASGVCIDQHMETDSAGNWRVAGWSGFIACADPRARDIATDPNAPNRAP